MGCIWQRRDNFPSNLILERLFYPHLLVLSNGGKGIHIQGCRHVTYLSSSEVQTYLLKSGLCCAILVLNVTIRL